MARVAAWSPGAPRRESANRIFSFDWAIQSSFSLRKVPTRKSLLPYLVASYGYVLAFLEATRLLESS